MFRSLFHRDVFAELGRFQRDMHSAFDQSPGIGGLGRGCCPALSVGNAPGSAEIHAFAPGKNPAAIEVHLDRGVLAIADERRAAVAPIDEKTTLHINKRLAGRFRHVISLPDDADPNGAGADYRDGVLRVRIPKAAHAQPRRFTVQVN